MGGGRGPDHVGMDDAQAGEMVVDAFGMFRQRRFLAERERSRAGQVDM